MIIHATCVCLKENYGVLLMGESGVGKSSLALSLIDNGANLVADDQCILYTNPQKSLLYAKPPVALAGILEIYGVGLVQMPHQAYTQIQRIFLIHTKKIARYPTPLEKSQFFDISIPLIHLYANNSVNKNIVSILSRESVNIIEKYVYEQS